MTPRIVAIVLLASLMAPGAALAATSKPVEKPKAAKKAKKKITLAALVDHALKNGQDEVLTKAVVADVGLTSDLKTKMVSIIDGPDDDQVEHRVCVTYKQAEKNLVADKVVWRFLRTVTNKGVETYYSWMFLTDQNGVLSAAAKGEGAGDAYEQKKVSLDPQVVKAYEDMRATMLEAGLRNLK